MKGWRLSFCFAAVAVLVLALAGRAEAACESQHRVSRADSECLLAYHSDSNWMATNDCDHGIRLKIDIKDARDQTKDLGGDRSAAGAINTGWGVRIRGIYCCSDYSAATTSNAPLVAGRFPWSNIRRRRQRRRNRAGRVASLPQRLRLPDRRRHRRCLHGVVLLSTRLRAASWM